MKALTVRQPWAWAIARGGKLIENRSPGAVSWQPRLNLAIHAGSSWSKRGATDDRVKLAWFEQYRGLALSPESEPRLRGGIILAVVDLVDVHPDAFCCRPWGESEYAHASGAQVRDVTHLVLENVRPCVPPVEYRRGMLGLWTVPESVEREVLSRIEAA